MNQMLCGYRDDERMWDEADEMTDGPELSAPVWLRDNKYTSAVEKSAKVDAEGLCEMWQSWRKSDALPLYLHGFLIVSSLRGCDAAWGEIKFLYDMLESEAEE